MAKKNSSFSELVKSVDVGKIDKILRKGKLKNHSFEITAIHLTTNNESEALAGHKPRICEEWGSQVQTTTDADGTTHTTIIPVCLRWKPDDDE
jgi:hypothetical protein